MVCRARNRTNAPIEPRACLRHGASFSCRRSPTGSQQLSKLGVVPRRQIDFSAVLTAEPVTDKNRTWRWRGDREAVVSRIYYVGHYRGGRSGRARSKQNHNKCDSFNP
jgi:hypothetical protein